MPLDNPTPGWHSNAEYVTPGLPYVTGSATLSTPLEIKFPKVTRAVIVRNLDTSNDLYIGFSENGVLNPEKRFTLPGVTDTTSERFELRIRSLWVLGETAAVPFSIVGELTLIPTSAMPILTGSQGGAGYWEGIE